MLSHNKELIGFVSQLYLLLWPKLPLLDELEVAVTFGLFSRR